MEIYSPEGLRLDGRRWNELRRFDCRINTHPVSCDGSSYIEQGNSKIVCMVQGPMEPSQRAQSNQSQASLEVNISIASFSTTERRKRQKNEKRIIELRAILERTFEQSVICKLYPRTLIQVNLHVLAQDGGLLASMTNAVTLALVDAGVAMYDYVSGVTAGLYNTSPLLDLSSLEEKAVSSLSIGVIGKSEKLALLLLEDKMPLDLLEPVLAISLAGAHRIREIMDHEVRRHGSIRSAKQK